MLKWLSKFILEILPSVVATIVGAYIVNHYIAPKPAAPAFAAAAPANDLKNEAKAEPAADKGGDKASFEKAVAEKAAIEKTAEKAAEKTEQGEPKRHTGTSRAQRPAVAAAREAKDAAKDTTASIDDGRNASDLARAALERQRGLSAETRSQVADPARLQDAPRAPQTPPPPASNLATIQPLPAPIQVSAPNGPLSNPAVFEQGAPAAAMQPAYPQQARADDPRRPLPPGEIPQTRPVELHTASSVERTSVAEDVMSAAKSVFHAVLPR